MNEITEIEWLATLIDQGNRYNNIWTCRIHPLLPTAYGSSVFGCKCKGKGILFDFPHFVNGFCCRLNEYARGS